MILVLNNKANLTYDEAKYYEKCLRKYNLIILPSNCYLPMFKKGKYILGSQDISEFKELNRTGEINARQLKSLKVKYSLVGHSERRIYNKENNISILNKLERCFENDIIPLYCIGDINDTYDELIKQIDVVENRYSDREIIYVYEPVNNIGVLNPDLNNLEEKTSFIKDYIKDNYYKDIKLIYGGGINIDNIDYIKSISCIDGIIISTESLNLNHLSKLYVKTK